ncbi:MAG: methyltransferase family protein [Candidatus Hodarchaeales archaeon]
MNKTATSNRNKRENKGKKLKTKDYDRYFIVSTSLIFFLALFLSLLEFVFINNLEFHFSPITLLGLTCTVFGVSIRIIARMTLKEHFTHRLKTLKQHQLINFGIYRYIRNPAYLGILSFSCGIPLIFSSLIGFLLMILMIPCFLFRIKVEEKMLHNKFGGKYEIYKKHTWALIPYIY